MNGKMKRLLEWIGRTSPLESQIVASGLSKTLNEALLNGWADIIADPHVKEGNAPAAAVRITDDGREKFEIVTALNAAMRANPDELFRVPDKTGD